MGITNMSVPTDSNKGVLLMPKLQNRFRVSFVYDTNRYVTGNVVSVTRPTLSFDPVTLEVYNSRVYIPGKHTWNTVEIVMRDTVDSKLVKIIDEQLARQIDMASQSVQRAASAFKFVTNIETLDGFNPAVGGLENKNILDSWKLYGCYFENVAYGNNDYSSSEPVTITVTLKYDTAEHIVDRADTLSNSTPLQTNDVSSTTSGSPTSTTSGSPPVTSVT